MEKKTLLEDIIRVEDEFYIRANSSLAEETVHVLKYGEMFAVFNQDGNIRPFGFENHGLYFEGTRFLSRYLLNIDGKHPLLLSSTVLEKNELMTVDLTNPDLVRSNEKFLQKDQVHFFRSCFLTKQFLHERVRVSSFSMEPIEIKFGLEFEADYVDIFEVRGMSRKARGELMAPLLRKDSVELTYIGLDAIKRKTNLIFYPEPSLISGNHVEFNVKLEPKQQKDFYISIVCNTENESFKNCDFKNAWEEVKRDHVRNQTNCCTITTSNEQFNDWIDRSSADLFMMLSETPDGTYPYAGIPWFSTVFGRDGLITALESLWMFPQIAKGVLQYLSRHQAYEINAENDSEPGKILHEARKGEMAKLKEIPFGHYYGSIDSTLLYMILAGYYYERTCDIELIKEIWPNLMAALEWTYQYGDLDGDGFIEYQRKASSGLSQQGWKDSEDSVFHKDGRLADPPIALCEVQAYLFDAKLKMSYLAKAMGDDNLELRLLNEAGQLKKNFIESFWCKDINMFAIALDGKKQQCKVLSSNAGQCLISGIVPKTLAAKVREHLMGEHYFSGWGIRTIANTEKRFNPMSYHNGSVWPHDNALIAFGLGKYGYKDSVAKIMAGLFDASLFMHIHRLPELFCGFPKRPAEGPTLYPVACNPQAWASAAVFMLLQSCLGISVDACQSKIYITKPLVPLALKEVRIRNLSVGKASVDINMQYDPVDVGIKLVRRKGNVDVLTVK